MKSEKECPSMANREARNVMLSAKNGETDEDDDDEEEKEKWIAHYSSNHQILLVGEGDFSFSLSLANAFASASNICASSLDSYDRLMKKYKNAKSNLGLLEKLGACLLHGVDATKMKHHTDLANRKFDRIIFNFPHAGFHGKEDNPLMIQMHRDLVQGFFRNARGMLRANGEIHVNHKTSFPFYLWNLEQLAAETSLVLIQRVDFNIKDYPGYHNKRGDRSRCDEPFPLGESSTFKFSFHHRAKNVSKATIRLGPMHGESRHCQTIPMPMQQQSTSDFNYPERTKIVNRIPLHVGLPPTIPNGNQHSRVLDRYLLNGLVPTYQRNSYGVDYPERLRSDFDAMHYGLGRVRHGLDRQMAEMPRTSNGNFFYKHEDEQVRNRFYRQMLEVPRTLDSNLFYKHEHEEVRHSLHRQMVEVPRTLNGSLYDSHEHEHERVRHSLHIQMLEEQRTLSEHEHERVRHGLDGQMVDLPRTLNGNLQHGLDRQMVELPGTLNSYLYNTHEHDQLRNSLGRQRVEVPRTLNSNLYHMHQHEHERVMHTLDRQRVEVPRTLNSYLHNMHEHDQVRLSLDRQRVEVPRTLNGSLYSMNRRENELHHIGNSRPDLLRPPACQAYQPNAPNTRDFLRL